MNTLSAKAAELKELADKYQESMDTIIKRISVMHQRYKNEKNYLVSDELANILSSAGVRMTESGWIDNQ